MNTYIVETQMAINRRPQYIIVEAENAKRAKYNAKKIARTADGQYPKVNRVQLVSC